MRPPTLREVRENVRQFFADYIPSVAGHYIFAGGGAIIGTALLLFPNAYQGVRVSGLWLVILLFAIAGYLAWRGERQRANEEHKKVIALQERMKSRIRISCGRNVEQSIVQGDGEYWFRAKLDLEGHTAIPGIEARVINLLEDGQKVPISEYLTLTMFPGMLAQYPIDLNLKTLAEGSSEFIDVIHITKDGLAIFPLKFYPGSVDVSALLKPRHTYQVTVAIINSASPPHPTKACVFEFEWTGDPNTSDIRLLNVTPPLPSLPSDTEACRPRTFEQTPHVLSLLGERRRLQGSGRSRTPKNYFGRRNKACAPWRSSRFMSIKVPSCASAI